GELVDAAVPARTDRVPCREPHPAGHRGPRGHRAGAAPALPGSSAAGSPALHARAAAATARDLVAHTKTGPRLGNYSRGHAAHRGLVGGGRGPVQRVTTWGAASGRTGSRTRRGRKIQTRLALRKSKRVVT